MRQYRLETRKKYRAQQKDKEDADKTHLTDRELMGELPQLRCTNSDRAREFGRREGLVAALVAADAGDRRMRA